MDELFQRLEKQIRDLIDQQHLLKHSNSQLHQGKLSLARDKDALLTKQKKAVTQIERLVSKLKEIESLS